MYRQAFSANYTLPPTYNYTYDTVYKKLTLRSTGFGRPIFGGGTGLIYVDTIIHVQRGGIFQVKEYDTVLLFAQVSDTATKYWSSNIFWFDTVANRIRTKLDTLSITKPDHTIY